MEPIRFVPVTQINLLCDVRTPRSAADASRRPVRESHLCPAQQGSWCEDNLLGAFRGEFSGLPLAPFPLELDRIAGKFARKGVLDRIAAAVDAGGE